MNNELKKVSRRNFLRQTGVTVGSVTLLRVLGQQDFAQAAELAPVDESSATAAALGYKHDATKVDTTKFPKRATPEGQKQFCENCTFYSEGGQKVAGHEGNWGKCTIFPTGLVAEKGWCNTWTLKAGMSL